jgi:hypothetical protein
MPGLRSLVVLIFAISALVGPSAIAAAERPSRATCEEAVRSGLQALTEQPIDQVQAIIDDWGSADTDAALGLPAGCHVPPSIPAIEPLDNGDLSICLWWNPESGALGEALGSDQAWPWGWWECIGPAQ